MTERDLNFKYETRNAVKTIPVVNVHVSDDGTFSVKIEEEVFRETFGNPNKAINAYNRSLVHG